MLMKSSKLKNNEEKQKMLEEQKKNTAINAQNPKLNFIQKNPQCTGALALGIFALFTLLFLHFPMWVALVILMFAEYRLIRAKKIGEDITYIIISYIFVYLPILLWILNSFYFAYQMIENTK